MGRAGAGYARHDPEIKIIGGNEYEHDGTKTILPYGEAGRSPLFYGQETADD
jgi:hypothetical protein